MKGVLKWVAGVASALVAVLLAVLGLQALRGEKERRERELQRAVDKEEQRTAAAHATMEREVEASRARLAAEERSAHERATAGAGVPRLRERMRRYDREAK